MFGWFKKKDETGVYTTNEKRIFKYWNGERNVKADPLVIFKRYNEKRLELSRDLILAKSIHSDADKGHTAAINKIRTFFDIKPPDNILEPWASKTLGEDQLMVLLVDFLKFIEDLKKNSSESQTISNIMGDLRSSSENAQPTNNSVASGSTPDAWSINAPGSSPMVSESPSETMNPTATTGSQLPETKPPQNS